jgi:hypothetical protein
MQGAKVVKLQQNLLIRVFFVVEFENYPVFVVFSSKKG